MIIYCIVDKSGCIEDNTFMDYRKEDIPDTLPELKRFTRALIDDYHLLKKDYDSLKESYNALKEEVRLLKHYIFSGHSEKGKFLTPETSENNGEPSDNEGDEENEEENEEDPERETITYTRRKKRSCKKLKLPAHLWVETVIHDLSNEEKNCSCGERLHPMGKISNKELMYTPARFWVREHIRYKYACRHCALGVKLSARSPLLLNKCVASAELIAHIASAKYHYHLPLYRQSEIYEQESAVEIGRGRLCSWLSQGAERLWPLMMVLKKHLIAGGYLQVDETPIRILSAPGGRKKSYMWIYRSFTQGQPVVYYDHQLSREGRWATEFLEGFKGYLQTDGYTGYHDLQSQEAIIFFFCWAHARRKYADVVKASKVNKGVAYQMLRYIRALYAVERLSRLWSCNAEKRKQLRQRHSEPILRMIYTYLLMKRLSVPCGSQLGKAIEYTLSHWEGLNRYIHYGEVEIDNNLVENDVRLIGVGRRNYLFFAGEGGGRMASIFYTLIRNCITYKLNPERYICYALKNIQAYEVEGRLDKLLPFNFDKALLDREAESSPCDMLAAA